MDNTSIFTDSDNLITGVIRHENDNATDGVTVAFVIGDSYADVFCEGKLMLKIQATERGTVIASANLDMVEDYFILSK